MPMLLPYLMYLFSLSYLFHISNSAEDSLVYVYSHALIIGRSEIMHIPIAWCETFMSPDKITGFFESNSFT
jgi:hypothetical protein